LVCLSLSEITLLFDLNLDLDRTLAQRKAKSKVKVTHCLRRVALTNLWWKWFVLVEPVRVGDCTVVWQLQYVLQ